MTVVYVCDTCLQVGPLARFENFEEGQVCGLSVDMAQGFESARQTHGRLIPIPVSEVVALAAAHEPQDALMAEGYRATANEDREFAEATSPPVFLTVEEAAAVLRIGRTAAYAAISSGEIPSIRIGRTVRVPYARLMEMANGND